MSKYVIINADDFGMCNAANRAVEELFECGGITSSTIMAPCAWSYDAVKFAAAHPEYAIGIHLTTTSEWGTYRWAPVNQNNTASLRDEEGFMWHESDQFEENCDLDEVKGEIIAQIEKLKSLGLNPSHFDNHMGSLYGIYKGRTEILEATLGICALYGMPFRIPAKFTDAQMNNETLDINIPREMIDAIFDKINEATTMLKIATPDFLMPGEWNGSQSESFENYKKYIYDLYASFEDGVTETYIHPAKECDELKAITGSWQRRVWEYELFKDPETRKYFESIGLKLINYRDLKELRGY
ncbi:MAG TPA: ChbG/HpnK family deacetylase [Clostridiales bacterium]|nr:ChbG/HpnK family deacetylase [Clostridiales bacterium]